jgi:hypothetical protein
VRLRQPPTLPLTLSRSWFEPNVPIGVLKRTCNLRRMERCSCVGLKIQVMMHKGLPYSVLQRQDPIAPIPLRRYLPAIFSFWGV